MNRPSGLVCLVAAIGFVILLTVLPGGCGTSARPPLPAEKDERLDVLIAAIDGLPGAEANPTLDAVSAAMELRDWGLEYRLPQGALDALREMKENDRPTEGSVDFSPHGGGRIVERTGNYAHLVFYTWALRDLETRKERIRFLWEVFTRHSESPVIRIFCVTEWSKMDCAETIPYLFAATAGVSEADWLPRHKAAVALDAFYPETRPMFEVLRESPDGWLAHHAEQVLLDNEVLKSVSLSGEDEATLAAHLKDERWLVRRAAVMRIGEFQSPAAAQSVIRALRDTDHLVREAAATVLGRMGDRSEASRVTEALLQVPLTEAALKDTSALVRLAALRSLRQVVVYVPLDVLEQAALDGNAQVRRVAIEMTEDHERPEAVALLLRSLQGGSDSARSAAAEALGQLGAAEAVQPLLAVLEQGCSDYVRSRYDASRNAAAKALGDIGDRRAVPALIDCLEDESTYLQKLCAEALGKIGDPRAIEPLEALMKQNRYGLARKAAEQAIAQIKETRPNR